MYRATNSCVIVNRNSIDSFLNDMWDYSFNVADILSSLILLYKHKKLGKLLNAVFRLYSCGSNLIPSLSYIPLGNIVLILFQLLSSIYTFSRMSSDFFRPLMSLIFISTYCNTLLFELLILFVSSCLAKFQSLVLIENNHLMGHTKDEATTSNLKTLQQTSKYSKLKVQNAIASQRNKNSRSTSSEVYIMHNEAYQQNIDLLIESMMDVFSYVIILQTLANVFVATLAMYFFIRTITESNLGYIVFTIVQVLQSMTVAWLYTNIGRGLQYEVREINNNL